MTNLDKLETLISDLGQDLPWQITPEGVFHLVQFDSIKFSVVTSGQDMPLEESNQRKKVLLYLQAVSPGTVGVLLTEITRLREQVDQIKAQQTTSVNAAIQEFKRTQLHGDIEL